MRFLPLLLFFLFCNSYHSLVAQQLSFRNITPDDGLPSSEVYYSLQDHNGYMWFATDAGVCRYNGYEFKTFTVSDGLTNNIVFHLCEDAAGRIWCDGFSGRISYIEQDKVYTIPANDSIARFLQNGKNIIRKIYVDQENTLWISTLRGIMYIKKEDDYRKCYLIANLADSTRLYGKMVDSVWLFSNMILGAPSDLDMELTIERKDRRTKFVVRPGPQSYTAIMNGANTRDGDVVFNVFSNLYLVNDTGHVLLTTYKHPPLFIYTGKDGLIWVSIQTEGVYCYKDNNFIKPFGHYLQGSSVSSICTDREDGMWFTTLEKGIMYCPTKAVMDYRNLPFLDERVCAIGEVNNGLLIGTYSGAILNYLIKEDTIHQLELYDKTFLLNDIYPHSNGAFIISSGTVGYADSAFNMTQLFYDRPPNPVSGLQFISGANGVTLAGDGTPFILSSLNLKRLDDTVMSTVHSKIKQTYFHQALVTALPSRGRVIFRTRENKILVGCLNGMYEFSGGKLHALGKIDSLLFSDPSGIAEDKNGVTWITTKGNGVVIRNGEKAIALTVTDGLPSNSCNAIDFDSDGNAWIGTNKGVAKIIVNYTAYKKSRIETYNVAHGIISDEIMKLRIVDEKLWLGTNKGLCTIDIKKLKLNSLAPPVFISGIRVDEKLYSRFDTFPELNYNQNTIHFFLEGISFAGKVDFLYYLQGFDAKLETTNQHEIVYGNLPPGKYKLVVYARNNDKTLSSTPAIFSFIIPAPFWKTWWFISLAILFIAGLIWFFVRVRLRKIRAREKEKTHVNKLLAEFQLTALRAQMNPHFIFNAINSIQSFVLLNNSQEAYNYLAKFSRLIRMVLNNAQDRYILLEQELSMLNLYVELEQLRFSSKFEYHLQLDPSIDDSQIHIPSMMFQPYVENAIWHGLMNLSGDMPGVLTITIRLAGEHLLVCIEDNGIGREKAKLLSRKFSHTSLGMELSRQRVELMSNMPAAEKSSVRVIDLYDNSGRATGTRVEVTVPVSYERQL